MPNNPTPPRSVLRHLPLSGFEYIALCGLRKIDDGIVMRTKDFPLSCPKCIEKKEAHRKLSETPEYKKRRARMLRIKFLASKTMN